MEREHRDAIRSNFSSLVEQTDLDLVVTALFEKGVFSEQMIEPFRNTAELERDRKRRLYMDITRRGPFAFGHLVDVLGELGYWDLVRELDPHSPFSVPTHRNYNLIPRPKLEPINDNDDFHSLRTLNRPNKAEPNKNNRQQSPPPPPVLAPPDAASDVKVVPQFTVKKSTKFMEDDSSKDLKLYRTRGRNRGVFLNFTYTEFDNNADDKRNGVDMDCNNLKYLFYELGFRLRRDYYNFTKAKTIQTLESLKNELVDVESVFIVVSSHGYERVNSFDTDVRCTDGQLISLYEIINYFNNRNMPALIGVPKVFIFQMCRGSSKDHVWQTESVHAPMHMSMPVGDVQYDGRPDSPHVAAPARAHAYARETPLYSDILIANSTVPGLVAHRDGKLGSWYIQVLCEVFADRAHDCHVEKLFTLVDQRMRDRYKVQTSSVDRWGFNKRLYLHPGLYEP